MVVTLPIDMKFTLADGSITQIPAGSMMEVDESTNFCVLGGFLPEDPRIATFQNDKQDGEGADPKVAKIVNFPLANTRLYKSALGAVKTYPTRRWIKVRGQNVHQVENLGGGSRIVVAGFLSSDKVPSRKEGKDFDYLDHILATQVVVLSATKAGAAPAKTAKPRAASTPAQVPAAIAALNVG